MWTSLLYLIIFALGCAFGWRLSIAVATYRRMRKPMYSNANRILFTRLEALETAATDFFGV